MQFRRLLLFVASVASVKALPPSMCDKYSVKLYGDKSPESQYKLLNKMVNTALAGNYSPDALVSVPGILNPGEYNGEAIDLFKYFDGSLLSTSQTTPPGSINFMDGGARDSLREGLPAYDNASKQFAFVTHLYQFFGSMMGCSGQGNPTFPFYSGRVSMYTVHMFMSLSYNEVSYHNKQVQLSGQSIGFSAADAETIFSTMQYVFNARCAPKTAVTKNSGGALIQHSCCASPGCPMELGSDCTQYQRKGIQPNPKKTPVSNSTSP